MKQRTIPGQSAGAAGVLAKSDARMSASRRARTGARIGARLAAPLATVLLTLTLAGCRHRTQWTPPPALTAPVELAPPPAQIAASIPPVNPPTYQPPSPPPDLWRAPRRRTPTRESAPQPAQAESGEAAQPDDDAALAIGSLSTGGGMTPQAEQQARDLIASIQRRIAALPRSLAVQQRSSLRQVANFVKHAQQALDSGDADGAVNLATKARLLMDDIEKK